MQLLAVSLVAAMLLSGTPDANRDDSTDSPAEPLPNLVADTLGGKQLWSDELIVSDWRVQRHALTGHCRLLDPDDHRHAWGSFEQCHQVLEARRQAGDVRPTAGRVVLLLHGLFRSRTSMQPLADYLAGQGDWTVLNIGYATTRRTVEEHAASLASIVDHLDEVTEINFVAHSLGNLVVRRFLSEQMESPAGVDPRIRRFVMLGPPNRGALLAETNGLNLAVRLVAGPVGRQLAFEWDELAEQLVIPTCEFGIVAGGLEHSVGWNPLLPGDDDGTLRVEETWLPGASDYAVLPVPHSFLMRHDEVQRYTLHFLETGHFPESDE